MNVAAPTSPVQVVIIDHPKDKEASAELLKRLVHLRENKQISCVGWQLAGEYVDKGLHERVLQAQVALVLLSSDLISDNFKLLMELVGWAHNREGRYWLIPIRLRSCELGQLESLRATPRGDRWIVDENKGNYDKHWNEVANDIKNLITFISDPASCVGASFLPGIVLRREKSNPNEEQIFTPKDATEKSQVEARTLLGEVDPDSRFLLYLMSQLGPLRFSDWQLICELLGQGSPLAEKWNKDSVAMSVKCRLRSYSQAGTRFLDMETEDLRIALQRVLPDVDFAAHDRFLNYEMGRLFSGLLFHGSPVLGRALRTLARTAATHDDVLCTSEWLFGILESIDGNQAWQGAALLIQALWRSVPLRTRIEQTIVRVLHMGGLDSLLVLIHALDSLPGFDALTFLRRILDEGQPGARRIAYFRLLHTVQAGDGREALSTLFDWSKNGQQSPSGAAAHNLLLSLISAMILGPLEDSSLHSILLREPPGKDSLIAKTFGEPLRRLDSDKDYGIFHHISLLSGSFFEVPFLLDVLDEKPERKERLLECAPNPLPGLSFALLLCRLSLRPPLQGETVLENELILQIHNSRERRQLSDCLSQIIQVATTCLDTVLGSVPKQKEAQKERIAAKEKLKVIIARIKELRQKLRPVS